MRDALDTLRPRPATATRPPGRAGTRCPGWRIIARPSTPARTRHCAGRPGPERPSRLPSAEGEVLTLGQRGHRRLGPGPSTVGRAGPARALRRSPRTPVPSPGAAPAAGRSSGRSAPSRTGGRSGRWSAGPRTGPPAADGVDRPGREEDSSRPAAGRGRTAAPRPLPDGSPGGGSRSVVARDRARRTRGRSGRPPGSTQASVLPTAVGPSSRGPGRRSGGPGRTADWRAWRNLSSSGNRPCGRGGRAEQPLRQAASMSSRRVVPASGPSRDHARTVSGQSDRTQASPIGSVDGAASNRARQPAAAPEGRLEDRCKAERGEQIHRHRRVCCPGESRPSWQRDSAVRESIGRPVGLMRILATPDVHRMSISDRHRTPILTRLTADQRLPTSHVRAEFGSVQPPDPPHERGTTMFAMRPICPFAGRHADEDPARGRPQAVAGPVLLPRDVPQPRRTGARLRDDLGGDRRPVGVPDRPGAA